MFSVAYLGRDAHAEDRFHETQCTELESDVGAALAGSPDSDSEWGPPAAGGNATELGEVHSIRVRTCFYTYAERTRVRESCSNVRINEGGGNYSYAWVCHNRAYTYNVRQRHCYTEVTTHNYRHTMLPTGSFDPTRQSVPLA